MMNRIGILLTCALLLTGCGDDGAARDLDGGDTSDLDGGDTSDAGSSACHAEPTWLPAWKGTIPASVQLRDTPYGFTSAGLAEAVAAAQAITGPAFDLHYDSAITGPNVISIGYEPAGDMGLIDMVVADGSSVIRLAIEPGTPGLDPQPVPGDRVDLTTMTLQLDFGAPRITEVSLIDWQFDGIVSSDHAVYVRESTGVTLDVSTPADFGTAASDVHWTHHIYGEIVSAGVPCGGAFLCYDLQHGSAAGPTVKLRTQGSAAIVEGDCVELYAPLSEFDGAPQFEIRDVNSLRIYSAN